MAMNDTVSDAELLSSLEKKYTPEPVPPCPVCGESMDMVAVGNGPIVWACTGTEDDPDKPGYIRRKEGRMPADEHYSRSRFQQYRIGDSDVLELVRRFMSKIA